MYRLLIGGGLSGSNDLLGDLVAKARQGARGETGARELLERENEMRLMKKSKTIIVGAAIAGLASTGIAYAYWTTSGTGSATATTGTVVGITVNETTSATNLYPGGPAQPLAGTFTNTNAGAVYVASVTAALGTLPGTCVPADFTIAGSAPVGANVASGTGVGTWSGLTIKMNNTLVSQDGCKAASIPLVLTSN
jgi:hypothetical protein